MADLEKFIETDANTKTIKINSDTVSDYIIETGTSEIWTYRKWHSGIAECWGTYVNNSVSMSNSWGNLYTANINTSRISYPFSFKERPREIVTMHTTAAACWAMQESSGYGLNTVSQTGRYTAVRSTSISTAVTVYLDFYVIGKWK